MTNKQIQERAEAKFPYRSKLPEAMAATDTRRADYITAFKECQELMSKEWVSVEDRLPEDDLVWRRILVDSRHHILPHFYADCKWWEYGSHNFTENVTHWQEFEDLPTKGENNHE